MLCFQQFNDLDVELLAGLVDNTRAQALSSSQPEYSAFASAKRLYDQSKVLPCADRGRVHCAPCTLTESTSHISLTRLPWQTPYKNTNPPQSTVRMSNPLPNSTIAFTPNPHDPEPRSCRNRAMPDATSGSLVDRDLLLCDLELHIDHCIDEPPPLLSQFIRNRSSREVAHVLKEPVSVGNANRA